MLLGLGLDVPYADRFTGATKLARASTSTNCSDDSGSAAFGLQQMLKDLGFYAGAIDGVMDQDVRNSVKAFGASFGIPALDFFPKGAICQAVMDAWQTAKSPKAPTPHKQIPTAPMTMTFVPPSLFAPKSAPLTFVPTVANPAASPGTPRPAIAQWWAEQSTGVKVAVVAVGVLGLGAIVMALRPRATATPNRSRRSRRARANGLRVGDYVIVVGRGEHQNRTGRIIDEYQSGAELLVSFRDPPEVEWFKPERLGRLATNNGATACRLTPPAKHRRKIAGKLRRKARPSDFAYPECFRYPIYDRAHAVAASGKFTRFGKRLPAGVRGKVKKRIEAAKRRFGVGR